MADDPTNESHGDEVGDEVQWYLDPDGTEWFAEDGVRYELADDGFAYPVVGGSTDPSGSELLEVEVDEDADWPQAEPEPAPQPTPTVVRVVSAKQRAAVDEPAEDADDTADTEPSPFAPRDEDGVSDDPTVTTRIVRVVVDEDGEPLAEPTATPAPTPAATVTERPTQPAPVRTGDGPARTATGRIDAEPLLSIESLDAGYGSLPVLQGVDMEIRPGETAVLLGLNGAGKTTTAWTISGALDPWDGRIMYDGTDVGGWKTGEAVRNGVVMVPEGRRVFPDLSVGRNLQVGAWGKRGDSDYVHAQRERVFDYFPRLREREKQLAGTLSGGEQQMLAMGRGLMADPRLLIIDEASMGLAPVIVKDVFDIVAQINEDGVTVLLIEQNVGALEVADVGYVMEQGRVQRVLEGEELRDRSVVSEALMG